MAYKIEDQGSVNQEDSQQKPHIREVVVPNRTKEEVVNVQIVDDRTAVLITYRRRSEDHYANGMPVPDKIWAELFTIVDGRLQFKKRIEGRHEPARNIPEKVVLNLPGKVEEQDSSEVEDQDPIEVEDDGLS
jgi:hypothetical protein